MDFRDQEFTIEYIIMRTKETRDITWLVKRLRDHERTITPELRNFISELLEQKYKGKKLSKLRFSKYQLKREIDFVKEVINGDHQEKLKWSEAEEVLKSYGIEDKFIDEKGEATAAAKSVVAQMNGVTLAQLDEILYPRKLREKPRQKFT